MLLGLLMVEGILPTVQDFLHVRHPFDQLADDAVTSPSFAHETHRVINLLKAIQHANKVLRLAAACMNTRYHPLQVGQLRQLRCELIPDGGVCIQGLYGIKARVDLYWIHEGMTDPLLEQSFAEWCDAAVKESKQRAF